MYKINFRIKHNNYLTRYACFENLCSVWTERDESMLLEFSLQLDEK